MTTGWHDSPPLRCSSLFPRKYQITGRNSIGQVAIPCRSRSTRKQGCSAFPGSQVHSGIETGIGLRQATRVQVLAMSDQSRPAGLRKTPCPGKTGYMVCRAASKALHTRTRVPVEAHTTRGRYQDAYVQGRILMINEATRGLDCAGVLCGTLKQDRPMGNEVRRKRWPCTSVLFEALALFLS